MLPKNNLAQQPPPSLGNHFLMSNQEDQPDSPAKLPLLKVLMKVSAPVLTTGLLIAIGTSGHGYLFSETTRQAHEENYALYEHDDFEDRREESFAEQHAEIDFGTFDLTTNRQKEELRLRVRFHLLTRTTKEKAKVVSAYYETHENRFRDRLYSVIDQVKIEDLAEPRLAELKGAIRDLANEMVGRHAIEEVIFSDFSLMEQ